MGRCVRGVRVHRETRRTYFDHGNHHECNRLTVMFNENGLDMKDDETGRGADQKRKRADVNWTGITVSTTTGRPTTT